MSELAAKFARLRQQVTELTTALPQANNQPTIIAVSKTQPAQTIKQAYEDAGQVDFGENYIQEAVAKIAELQDLPLNWHFIGHLQSNKARLAAANFAWVQTVHSLKLAQRLSAYRAATAAPLNILVQVNISNEVTKSGISPVAAAELCQQLQDLPNLSLRGLMAISKFTAAPAEQQEYFQALQELFVAISKQLVSPNNWDTLSMGMSHDLSAALIAGSNMLRVGRAIFGERS